MTKCCLLLLLTLSLVVMVQASRITYGEEDKLKSAVYFSPEIELAPGEVNNNYYANIDFPKGHIGVKDFRAELVDRAGNPVLLDEGYLHHWLTTRYYALVDEKLGNPRNRIIGLSNAGMCENSNIQHFGIGSETRKADYYVPDPYGIEVGNPADVPRGYEERWYLNIHAIDTRGAVDKHGCGECRCDLYNVTKDPLGNPLPNGYQGGSSCCYHKTRCSVKKGFRGAKKAYRLKYTVTWVDWDDSVVPVKVYIGDVTDTGERKQLTESDLLRQYTENTGSPERGCKIEYTVEPCDVSGVARKDCVDTRRSSYALPTAGRIVFYASHQHVGGAGAAIYREDGRRICSSMPIYGTGNEIGNEDGYLVGMTTCYPEPSSAIFSAGEKLIMESNYSSSELHTGVMATFYLLVADLASDDM